MKLNLGAGGKAEQGYINTDLKMYKGIDMVLDFNKYPFPFPNSYFDEVKMLNCIHCVEDEFKFMEEIYRITKRKGRIIIESPVTCSPVFYNDPLTKKGVCFTTFDKYCEEKEIRSKGLSYETKAVFRCLKRKWIFSDNPLLKWLSFIPNIAPKIYARFFYFYFPSNKVYWELEVI